MPDVLVVDDDTSIRFLLRETLEEEGYEVRLAADAAAGLDAVLERPPDVLILDLAMPKVSGAEFVRLLEARRLRTFPVLVLSARPDAPAQAQEVHAEGCLQKPFDFTDLMESLESLLRQ